MKKGDQFKRRAYENRVPNTTKHPPLSLKTAKELWIFWYGEEPEWSEILLPELLKHTGIKHVVKLKFICNYQ